MTAETRPKSAPGVTACRKLVVEIVQGTGPAPIRKKLDPASQAEGMRIVSSMAKAEATPAIGPMAIKAGSSLLPRGHGRHDAGQGRPRRLAET